MCHIKWIEISFSWAFKDNFFNTTLFYCSFKWDGETHWFDIYKSKRDSDTCPSGTICKWIIQKKDHVLMTFIAMIGINNY
jgi:hypothetical protein